VGIAPAIGIFVDVKPENFSVYKPKNVLFVVGDFDVIVDNNVVAKAFMKTTGGIIKENTYLNISGYLKTFWRIRFAEHIGIVFSWDTIDIVTRWLSRVLLGTENEPKFDYKTFTISMYVGLLSLLSSIFLVLISIFGSEKTKITPLSLVIKDTYNRLASKIILKVLAISAIALVLLYLGTKLLVSAIVLSLFLGYSLALINKEKLAKIRLSSMRDFGLGLTIGIAIILAIEFSYTRYVAPLLTAIISRSIQTIVFVILWYVVVGVILQTNNDVAEVSIVNFIKVFLNCVIRLSPIIIVAILYGIIMLPALSFLIVLVLIYIVLIASLTSLATLVNKLPRTAITTIDSLILGFISATFTPIIALTW